MNKQEILSALSAAWAAPVTPQAASGCGRAYVCVSGDKATVTAFAAAAKKLGLLFLRKAYGTSGNALYVGYDNGAGRELAKAEAVAASLKAAGLSAYADAVGD
jgi:hypothetical protein